MKYYIEKYGNNGKYRYVFELPATADNPRPRKTKGGFTTKKAAKQAAIEFEREYILGLNKVEEDILFSDYLDFWLNKMKDDVAPSTLRNYDKVIRNHLKPQLGSYMLRAIKRLVLEEFLKNLIKNGYSDNTVDNIKGVLTKAIRYAYLHDMVEGSCDSVISRLDIKVNSVHIRDNKHSTQQKNVYISKEDIEKLLTRFPEGNQAHIPIMLAYHLGLREGEAYGVRWKNIDFKKKTIYIEGQVTYNESIKEWVYYPPKNDSFRIINMDDELCDLLLREKARQDLNKKNKKYVNVLIDKNKVINYFEGEKADFVVQFKYGGFVGSNARQNIANVAHKELNIPFTFHSLRHTHCSDLAAKGVDVIYLYKRMGHKSIQTTLKYYTHDTDEMLENNFEHLNSIFE